MGQLFHMGSVDSRDATVLQLQSRDRYRILQKRSAMPICIRKHSRTDPNWLCTAYEIQQSIIAI